MGLQSRKHNGLPNQIALSYGFGKMKLDWAQRSAIRNGIIDANQEDIIIISDLDEIPRPSKLKEAIGYAKEGRTIGFNQDQYVYFFNGSVGRKSIGSKMCTVKTLKEKYYGNPQYVRIPFFTTRWKNKILGKKGYGGNSWMAGIKIIQNGGWHFSFLGNTDSIINKRKVYAHAEFSKKEFIDPQKVKKDIEEGKFVQGGSKDKIRYIEIDQTFPEAVQKNKKKYKNLIKNG